MSDMLKKLEYLNETKSSITESLNRKGVVVPDNTPFREYYKLIDDIGKNDFEDKEFLVDVLLGKKPELEGIITVNSSLKDIANQFMTIGAINFKFKENTPKEFMIKPNDKIRIYNEDVKINTSNLTRLIASTPVINKVILPKIAIKPKKEIKVNYNYIKFEITSELSE